MADAITELGGLSESMSRLTDMLSNKQLKWALPVGAKWAVLRAHYYSVPRKLLAIPGVFLLWLLRHWWPFN